MQILCGLKVLANVTLMTSLTTSSKIRGVHLELLVDSLTEMINPSVPQDVREGNCRTVPRTSTHLMTITVLVVDALLANPLSSRRSCTHVQLADGALL